VHNYSDPSFDWSSVSHVVQPANDQQARFEALGITHAKAKEVIESGFVFPEIGSKIIDPLNQW
jgi:hypothetical protein